jgi:hypothetical protein
MTPSIAKKPCILETLCFLFIFPNALVTPALFPDPKIYSRLLLVLNSTPKWMGHPFPLHSIRLTSSLICDGRRLFIKTLLMGDAKKKKEKQMHQDWEDPQWRESFSTW